MGRSLARIKSRPSPLMMNQPHEYRIQFNDRKWLPLFGLVASGSEVRIGGTILA
jgi:hypothetical protein